MLKGIVRSGFAPLTALSRRADVFGTIGISSPVACCEASRPVKHTDVPLDVDAVQSAINDAAQCRPVNRRHGDGRPAVSLSSYRAGRPGRAVSRIQSSETAGIQNTGRRRLGWIAREIGKDWLRLALRPASRRYVLDVKARLAAELSAITGIDVSRHRLNMPENKRLVSELTGVPFRRHAGRIKADAGMMPAVSQDTADNAAPIGLDAMLDCFTDEVAKHAERPEWMPAELSLHWIADAMAAVSHGRLKTVCIQLSTVCAALDAAHTAKHALSIKAPKRRKVQSFRVRATSTAIVAGLARYRFLQSQTDGRFSQSVRLLNGALAPFNPNGLDDNGRQSARLTGVRSHADVVCVSSLGYVAAVRL